MISFILHSIIHIREQTFDSFLFYYYYFFRFFFFMRWHSELISIIDSFNYFIDNCFCNCHRTNIFDRAGFNSHVLFFGLDFNVYLFTNCLRRVFLSVCALTIVNILTIDFGICLLLFLNSIFTFVLSVTQLLHLAPCYIALIK